MNSQKILYNKIGGDESYTPAYGVKPIIKYIPKNAIVWCPFDKEHSEFVKQIRTNGNSVIVSHIDNGKDFFEFEPLDWDIIISNPPFKNKRKFFERALSFGKPFALLMTNAALNDKYPVWCWEELGKQFQILKFDKRMRFINNEGRPNNKITFSSSYFCYNFLPNDFIQEKLNERIV